MSDFEIEVDADELDEASKNLLQLASLMKQDEESLQQSLPQKMLDKIDTSIRANFENTRTSDDDTSLLDAFYLASTGTETQITTRGSGADHARALEEGISPHTIEGRPALAFQPENPGAYPESAQKDNGYVVLNSVYWTPDKSETAEGYDYVYNAQQMWATDVKRELPRTIQESIRSAGFKRGP